MLRHSGVKTVACLRQASVCWPRPLLANLQRVTIRSNSSEPNETPSAGAHDGAATRCAPQARHQPRVLVNHVANSYVAYLHGFLPVDIADSIFSALVAHGQWTREVDAHGPQDRLSAYYGDSECVFGYVGLTLQPKPWLPCLVSVRDQLNTQLSSLLQRPCTVTGCLVNNYEPGQGFIVWHSDEVRAHGNYPLIVSVTLGGERVLELRHKNSGEGCFAFPLENGSALVMAGNTQRYWEHRLPLPEKPTPTTAPHRISLTFRSIVPGWERAFLEAGGSGVCNIPGLNG